MSIDYNLIPDATFQFGNSADIHNSIKQALITETTDHVNSNFLLVNPTASQTLQKHLHVAEDDDDDDDETDQRLARKKYINQKHYRLKNTNDNDWYSSNVYHGGDLIRSTADGTLLNSLTRKQYVDDLLANKQNLISSGTNLTMNQLTVGNVFMGTAKNISLSSTSSIIGNGVAISAVELSYLDNLSSNCQTQLNNKQNLITDGSLTIARTNGLQTALDAKQNLITDASLTIARTSGLQSAIDSKQNLITDSSLTIARTTGLQSALDAKQAIISDTNQIQTSNIYNLDTQLSNKAPINNPTFTGIAYVDTPINSTNSNQIATTSYVKNVIGDLIASAPTTLDTLNEISIALNNDPNAFSTLSTLIGTKQNTLTSGSISDSLLSSTFVKPSTDFTAGNITLGTSKTISGVNATTMGYLDATSSIQTQLNSKLSSISNASISDSMLVSTFVKPSTDFTAGNITLGTSKTISGVNATTMGYLDATSSIQTQLNSKLSSISNASITDSMLVSSFVKPSTAPTLTGTNFSSIPTSSILSGALTVTSLSCTSETDSGNALFGSISEKIYSIGNNGTSNSYTLDYVSNGAVFAITSNTPSANFTIRLNNCGTNTDRTINFSIIYTSLYYCNTITAYSDTSTQITLSSSTPLFAGGTPSLSSGTVLIQSFTLIRSFGSNYLISNVANFY